MSDAKRQVGIKTRSVKRLAADVRSYLTEKATHESAFLSASAAGSGREPHEIRRAREFVEEADNTLLDVRQRLQESFVGLQRFLAELAAQGDLHAPLLADAAVEEARAVLREVAPLVNSAEAVEAAVQRAFKVCVLGDSQLNEDDALWRTTEQLGECLARGGFHVVSGGYAGTAEAASFGASRVAAASVAGVTCPSAFANTPRGGVTGPNQYLSEQQTASDLLTRAAMLVHPVDACVVLPGGLGTLTKLSLAWNMAAVESWNGASGQSTRVILAWRDPWESLLASVGEALRIPADLMQCVRFVSSVDEIMQQLEQAKVTNGAAANGSSSSSSAAQ